MAQPALQLALAGFGQLGQRYYVPALRSLKRAKVSLVIDPLDSSRRAALAAFPGIDTSQDPSALLTRRLDGVIVASPPSTHLALWKLAADVGLPVFMEKPFALRGEVREVAADEARRHLLMLDLNRRFWPPYQLLRRLVQAGRLGGVRRVDIWLHVDVGPWCSVTSHRLQPSEGGVLYDLGSQAIDLACWITERQPQKIVAYSESHRWQHDHVTVTLALDGGMEARCSLAYTTRAQERVVVTGERGKAWMPNPNMAVHLAPLGTSGTSGWSVGRDLLTLGYRGLRRSRSMMRYSVAAALKSFTESISHGFPFSPGFQEALASTKCLDEAALAMEQSMALGSTAVRDCVRHG